MHIKFNMNFTKIIKNNLNKVIALFFTVWGLYLRYQMAANRPFHTDENYLYIHTIGPFQPFWQRISYGEVIGFPGDYLLLYPFTLLFDLNSKWGLLIPHIFATLVGFYVLFLICQRYFKSFVGYAVTFAVVCFNWNLIWHAFEYRPYPVMACFGVLLFYLVEMIVDADFKPSFWKKFWIYFLFFFVFIFHPFAVMNLFFCGMFFLLKELSRRSFKDVFGHIYKFLIPFLIIALPILFYYATGGSSFSAKSNLVGRGINIFQYIPNPLVDALGFLKGIVGNLIGFKMLYIFLVGMVISWFIPHKNRLLQWGFLFVLVVIPIMTVFLLDLKTGYWFIQRQFIWVLPLFAVYLGWCWDVVTCFVLNKVKDKKH